MEGDKRTGWGKDTGVFDVFVVAVGVAVALVVKEVGVSFFSEDIGEDINRG